jgi:release factor glutamine methyltransferase
MTIAEFIQYNTAELERNGVESPRLQVEWMLAHVLNRPRLELMLDRTRVLTRGELGTLLSLVARRGAREPLQHLLGGTSFCGLDLAVDRHVLIPRPETERLVELAWDFLSDRKTVLDFGTGSGCLAIAVAARFGQARIWGVDISQAALRVARVNATAIGVQNQIQFICGDGLAALGRRFQVDLILSNPPYIPSGEIAGLDPEVRDHDPRNALDGGVDGLDFYRRLAGQAGRFLRRGGRLMVEFGDGQADAVAALVEESGWRVDAVEKDLCGTDRFLIAHQPESREDGLGFNGEA